MATDATVQEQSIEPPRTGKDGRSIGGYFNNRNSLRHGLRAAALPAGCTFIHKQAKAFRQSIEDAVVASYGAISITHACYIQSAVRAEVHANLCARWLRNEEKTLTPAERHTFSAAVVKATEARDRCIEKLALDRSAADSFDIDYRNALNSAFTASPAESNVVAQEGIRAD